MKIQSIPNNLRSCFGVVSGAFSHWPKRKTILQETANLLSMKRCRGLLVLGNMGNTTQEITEAFRILGASRSPLLVLPGATEHMKHYKKAFALASLSGIDIVDLSNVRILSWPDITLLAVPGHHRHQALGAGWWACGFTTGDVKGLSGYLHAHPPKRPIFLVSHASPLMDFMGSLAFDLGQGGAHGGSKALTNLAASLRIRFSVSAQMDETGPAAIDPLKKTSLSQNQKTPRLWLHPGVLSPRLSPRPSRHGPFSRHRLGTFAVIAFHKTKGANGSPSLVSSYELKTLATDPRKKPKRQTRQPRQTRVPIPKPRTEEPGARRGWMQGAATQE